jgi:hypothetical protein
MPDSDETATPSDQASTPMTEGPLGPVIDLPALGDQNRGKWKQHYGQDQGQGNGHDHGRGHEKDKNDHGKAGGHDKRDDDNHDNGKKPWWHFW